MKKSYVFYGLRLVLGMSFAWVMVWAAVSFAEGEFDTGTRALPYVGEVKYDGQPYHGELDVMIKVDNGETYTEVHETVFAYGGRFKVDMGRGVAVSGEWASQVHTQGMLRVAVGFRDARLEPSDDEADYHFVREDEALVWQRVHPVPFAYWGATSDDFHTSGAVNAALLDVQGHLSLRTAQPVQITTANVGGDLKTPYGAEGGLLLEGSHGASVHMLATNDAGTDVAVNGSSLTGMRFTHRGDTILEVTQGGVTAYKDLVINGALDVQGDYDSFVLEDQVSLQITSTGSNEQILGDQDGRACFLTGTQFGSVDGNGLGGSDVVQECNITTDAGNYVLGVSANGAVSSSTPVFCSAQCLRW